MGRETRIPGHFTKNKFIENEKKKTIKLTGGNGTFLPLKSERKKD